jgi:hypothetical protein
MRRTNLISHVIFGGHSIFGQSLLEASGRTRNSHIYLDSTQSVTLMLIYH